MIDLIAYLTGKEPEQVCREWHSLWIGWAEMICLSIPSRFPITDFAKGQMKDEFHYYNMGRASGVICWVIILAVLL